MTANQIMKRTYETKITENQKREAIEQEMKEKAEKSGS